MATDGKISEATGFLKAIPVKSRAWLVFAALVIAGAGFFMYEYKDVMLKKVDASIANGSKLDDVINKLNIQSQETNEVKNNVNDVVRKLNDIQKQLDFVEELTVKTVIFNPNMPEEDVASAYNVARRKGYNHKIKENYVKWIQVHPHAAWKTEKKEEQSYTLRPKYPTGSPND